MQQELLLEIFSEEIPARLQKSALENSSVLMKTVLEEYGAEFSEVESYVSPRRIALRVISLNYKTKDLFEEKRGPKITAPQNAIDGFLRSNNKEKEDLIQKDEYYYINLSTKGTDIKTVIPSIIEEFINRFPWQKTMRWYIEKSRSLSAFWVRPIRSILCIYDGSVINGEIKSVGVGISDFTYGHRFLSSDPIRVFDFEDYVNKLEKNHVMIDYNKKISYIDRELSQKAASTGLCVQMDDSLLEEVAGLVEYPFVHIGTIDEKFMHIPSEVLSTSMKVHQKYFTLMYPDSIVAPFYGTVTNVPGTDIMHDGLDRVLRARLSDASFFFKEDTEVSLDAFAQRLSNVVFHEKLGSVAQKVDRLLSLAETKEENRAISLCKADLVTQMVGEFPELQGVMGEIYAIEQEEDENVAVAIREHYKPNGAKDSLPSGYLGARLSFFDKLDTLVGFLGVGIYPTGSRDPFALRRAALSIVRLLCDVEYDILQSETMSYYIETLISSYSEQGIALDQDVEENVIEFIIERLKIYMEDKENIDYKVIESVIYSFKTYDFDFKHVVKKAKILQNLSERDDFEIVQSAYKRAKGVISSEQFIEENVDISLLKTDNVFIKDVQNALLHNISIDDYEKYFNQLIVSSKAVLDACENIVILDQDIEKRKTNIALFFEFVKSIRGFIGEISDI